MCSCSLFFSPSLIFTLVAANISHFLTAATKCSCCAPTENVSFCFFSLALLSSFSRWASLACCPTFSFSLSFSFSVFQICRHDNYLSLINTLDNTDTKTFSAFRFRLSWLFSWLCLTRSEAGGHTLSGQNNLTSGIGLHEVCQSVLRRINSFFVVVVVVVLKSTYVM